MTDVSLDPAVMLSNERLRLSLAVRDWILGEAREISDPNIILEGVSLMLRDAGIPIDRATSAVELRHAERAANARIWEFGSSARDMSMRMSAARTRVESARSPKPIVSTCGSSCRTRPTTPTTSSRR